MVNNILSLWEHDRHLVFPSDRQLAPLYWWNSEVFVNKHNPETYDTTDGHLRVMFKQTYEK